ncbi:MAG TPA: ADP-ribosylglycohydrolase family protein [Deltaproteobacteria bacterium]|nr:ADP-ribosylglycohydrolase family protein [Deltaproteobacteria bacterium]HQI82811.1 ADP-ribosylglycohydrolase family protein [Deltaproteobacteria bacterium]
MIGAIAGDIIGSVYERHRIKTKDFPLFGAGSRFTDDTVLTVALAEAILTGQDYGSLMREYCRRYPRAGYGGLFRQWAADEFAGPYNSFGNGAAMRISPVGFAFDDLGEVLERTAHFTRITHDHPEGVRGAQATAAAVFLARTGSTKEQIRRHITTTFAYDLDRTLDGIRPRYRFDVTCQGSVPEAIIAFLESSDYEDAVRNAVSLGGDSDTQACIAGGIAEAYYGGVPVCIKKAALALLDDRLRSVALGFMERFPTRRHE